ncbi:GvpL/GvpF family gas vesicle protein [Streptomyces sp. NPDC101227]|uniref:GvpL/GvpF family gas vesicle protein n=1 Tax=Streptomyces sp. NPDC101227 TaxID=3366136 RepID=UPI00382692C6
MKGTDTVNGAEAVTGIDTVTGGGAVSGSEEACATAAGRDNAPAPVPEMTYVYAVGHADPPLAEAARRLPGLGDGAVRTVTEGTLMALVSSVPADAYSADGLQRRMENLAELEVIARTHHEVVEAAHGSATVLPMRLATVYLDDARVRAMLQERAAAFAELLSCLANHVEVGVKVFADRRAAATPAPDAPCAGPAAGAAGAGRAYLQRRRAQRHAQRDAYRAAEAVAAAVAVRAAEVARARVAHRPQQGELASGAGENIANDAYLVPAGRVLAFHQALADLPEDVPGVRVEITGPWAPYSFATPSAAGIGS